MIVINNIDSQRFTFNGVEYFKNFTPIVIGDKIRILNTYDSSIELTDSPRLFSEFEVDGLTYASVTLLQSDLLPVLYSRNTLGGSSGAWGDITGTLSDQTDLQSALDSKLDKVSTTGVERAYIINADGSQSTKATSEIGTTQNYFTFSTNTTLSNTHHNAVIWVTATCNITIPSGLRSDFNCTFRTLTGAIATFLTSGTTINSESDGDVQSAKTMSYLAQYTTNNYIISGGGLS